jgi:hypothetical protein
MKLKKLNGIDYYQQSTLFTAEEEYIYEEEEVVIVEDKPTNITADQIHRFLCEESMIAAYKQYPYAKKVDLTYIP